MTTIDIILYAGILLIAILFSWSGFLQQVVTLLTLIVASWTGIHFSADIGHLFEGYIEMKWLRDITGGAIVFLLILAIGFWLTRILTWLTHRLYLHWINKLLGFFFGVLMGGVLVWMALSAAVLMPYNPPLSERDWWRDSRVIALILSHSRRIMHIALPLGADKPPSKQADASPEEQADASPPGDQVETPAISPPPSAEDTIEPEAPAVEE
jgi:uncharacterized membrane protein required for colicin V production